MDARIYAEVTGDWFTKFDEARMVCTIEWENEDGEEVETEVKVHFEACPTCDGHGHHVDPAIDAHGIGADEWADWDMEEKEAYHQGRYDVTCSECHGRRVVPVPDDNQTTEADQALKHSDDMAADAWSDYQTRRMESGWG